MTIVWCIIALAAVNIMQSPTDACRESAAYANL
jgi:hypothetical protein